DVADARPGACPARCHRVTAHPAAELGRLAPRPLPVARRLLPHRQQSSAVHAVTRRLHRHRLSPGRLGESRQDACGDGRHLHGWDAVTGRPIPVPEHLPIRYREGLSCSRDGRWMATAVVSELVRHHDTSLQVWDLQTLQLHKLAAPHPGMVTTVALSPDGNLIVTGCEDGKARLSAPA